MMNLRVDRTLYTEKTIIGRLFIDNKFICFTLEDVCRDANRDGDLNDPGEAKVFGKTAIPSGTYKMILSKSTRFKRLMPEILSVPGFKGIRMHNGNTPEHTEGCILVGATKSHNFVGNSRVTFEALMKKLVDSKLTEFTITIKDGLL